MQSKEKNNKTTCTENNRAINVKNDVIDIPDEVIAELVQCSPSLVKKVRLGKRKAEKGKGQKVAIAHDMWEYGSSLLIQEIKNRINL